MQTTSHILMIRPVDFKYNEQTAGNNNFQQNSNEQNVQEKALAEFDGFVNILRGNGLDITVIDDTAQPATPDSIFPNNWVSFHDDGQVFLYPMHSENRRAERRKDILDKLSSRFNLSHITDLSFFEKQVLYLEGTGSMVLDRVHKIAYACLSVRTDMEVLNNFCMLAGYSPVAFQAVDGENFPIYHTNVMMCVADKYVVICLDAITNHIEKENVTTQIRQAGQEIIPITLEQMNSFAGNMLQVENNSGEKLLIMSESAQKSLTEGQLNKLKTFDRIVTTPLYTIETNGGGSARCMMAEIHSQLLP